MPKSTPEVLAQLRADVFARDGGCIWPGTNHDGPLQMAHLEHRGMGGRASVNTLEGCVTLCELHHNVYDGRISGITARRERAEWLRMAAGIL